MSLFDAYVFVDWSAAGRPTRKVPRADAIWSGELVSGGEPHEHYHRTRAEALAHVRATLVAHVREGRRALVGFDFPYGYPAGLASFVARDGLPPWRAVWSWLAERIEDDARNRNNRFEVAAELNRMLGDGPGPSGAAVPMMRIPVSAPR